MTFAPPFSRVFSPTFDRRNATAAANIWWTLNGVIPAANCIAAYQAKGSASYAASKSNLANPGTYDLTDGTAYPAWAAATGWTFTAASSQYLTIGGGTGWTLKPVSYVARINSASSATYRIICSGANNSTAMYLNNVNNKPVFDVVGVFGFVGTTSVTTDKTIGATYSALGVCVLYLDGATNGGATSNQVVSSSTNTIGATPTPAFFFNGVIVALAVYNVVLDGTNMAALATAINAL